MIIIKADTLEEAMAQATAKFDCSVTELQIEVIEYPKSGFLGFLKKQAVIAVVKKSATYPADKEKKDLASPVEDRTPPREIRERQVHADIKERVEKKDRYSKKEEEKIDKQSFVSSHSDLITPSLVTAQDDFDDVYDENEYKRSQSRPESKRSKEDIQRSIATAEAEEASIKRISQERFKEDIVDSFFQSSLSMQEIINEIDESINKLFSKTCFALNNVEVSAYDENTVLIEFTGNDAALLIGKEGYRYKALSYMLFNWINAKYGLQLRLEIAEFLKNQEDMVHKYLEGIIEQVNKNGRAQTKILDGVLVQIALKRLRNAYPDKYVAIRTNRDGLKYIIINSFRSNNA